LRFGPLSQPSRAIVHLCAEHLGEVEAPDERSAIKKAAEEFNIPPERQDRISVRKLDKKK
jgi:hypothetical protein